MNLKHRQRVYKRMDFSDVRLSVVIESLTHRLVPRLNNDTVEIRRSYLSRVFHHFRERW